MRKFYIENDELHEIITEQDTEIAECLPELASDWATFMVFYGSYDANDDTDYDGLIEQAWQMCNQPEME